MRSSSANAVIKQAKTTLILLFAVLIFFQPIVLAATSVGEYDTGPVPTWVVPVLFDAETAVPVSQVSQGLHYLLSDTQIRVEPQGKVTFRHFATKALSEQGVTDAANIEIDFDPSYQSLRLHDIAVLRGTQRIAKLGSATINILQREQDLESQIYDGSKTASVLLEDIRIGDVIEYAYSIVGANPVFQNKQFGQIDLRWGVPVQKVHASLQLPVNRKILMQARNSDIEPTVSEAGGYRRYQWQISDVPALVVDDDAPGWFSPYATVFWSEFRDWADVIRWALPLYGAPDHLSPAMQVEIDKISQSTADAESRLLAVLRFVQRDIRYLGIEIGPGSHAPNSPLLVFERRFGDCKDKALLTISMLNALNISAKPALVNTYLRRGVQDLAPMPGAFNHVLVRAHLNGRDYWLDPTRSPQQGRLENLYQPDYGQALVIDAEAHALVAMADPVRNAKRTIRAVFDIRGGLDKPVRYTVTTVAEGGSAESMRNTLASENREQLQKQYLNFYAGYYPDISSAGALAIVDEEDANRLTLTEQYEIKNFWPRAKKESRIEAQFYAADMRELLKAPSSSIRTAPLAVSHPIAMTHVTEVLLPERWDVASEKVSVENPAFSFEHTTESEGNRVVLTDSYRSLADQVEAADVSQYVADLELARDALGYNLYKYDKAATVPASHFDRFNWLVATLGILILMVWIWLATKLYRYNPSPASCSPNQALSGIGGWLLLPALAVIVFPLRTGVYFSKSLSSYAADTWVSLTTFGQAAYDPLWAPVLLFELGANLALIVFSLLLLLLFFKKRRSVPNVYIGFLIGVTLVRVADILLGGMIPAIARQSGASEWRDVMQGLLSLAIWGTYFKRSERVAATFVNDWQPKVAAVAEPITASGSGQIVVESAP